jgi:hypothetical protein
MYRDRMIMNYGGIRYVRSMSVNILYRDILLKDNVLRLFYRDIRDIRELLKMMIWV